MCGIAGTAGSRRYIGYSDDHCRAMTETLTHRGPDDDGYFSFASSQPNEDSFAVHLGMRRLAIIDRAGGQQPVGSDSVVVFNGEIYNHKAVRLEIEREGVKFRTNCDTEVIARGWDLWGPDIVDKLHGMFAIAVWDTKRRRLFLARDRMGKKPLYYHYDPAKKILLFGSEIKAILANPLYDRAINYAAIYHYLCLQYCPEPTTAFERISCVPPGSIASFDPATGGLDKRTYWRLKQNAVTVPNTETATQQIRGTMRNAVRGRLESEVPLGIYLSGGLDSSIVTGLAREAIGPDADLHTFAMGFSDTNFNELPHAARVAELFNTNHHAEIVDEICFSEMAEKIAAQYDQPFGDSSAIPTYIMAERSKKYITVALSGDGGDEAFGGYSRYWVADAQAGMDGYIPFVLVWPPRERSKLLTQEFKRRILDLSTFGYMQSIASQYDGDDTVNQMQYLDALTYLPNDIIVKMERATMAASVEARCPFLDHRVMELGQSIPSSLKVDSELQTGKNILKSAFIDMLPPDIIHREKRGFAVPIGEWFRRPDGVGLLAGTVFRSDFCHGLFDQRHIQDYVTMHMAGKMEIGHPIWLLVQLDLWLRRHF